MTDAAEKPGSSDKPEFKLHEAFKEPGADEFKRKGNEAFKEGKWDEAIKNYNKAIQLDPSQAVFYSNRAACWSSKGSHESALADAQRCIERDPKYVKGYTRKAKALFDLKKVDEAEAAYQEGLAVDASNEACAAGVADIRATRKKNRKSPINFGAARGLVKGLYDKVKSGGMGGRMQMYMVLLVAYYMFTSFTGRGSKGKSSGASSVPDAAEDDDDEASNAPPEALNRSFQQAGGLWLSYVEAEGRADTLLLLLHRTSSSTEAEFGDSLPQFMKKVAPPGGMRLLAPDRPCHGYSPCPPTGTSGTGAGWLSGLVARRRPKHLAIVAYGQEAALQALALVKQRQEKSQLLLVNPQALPPPVGAMAAPADLQAWLREHYEQAGSARVAADAAAWAVKSGAAAGKPNDPPPFADAAKLPEGSVVSFLYDDGEEEVKGLQLALEDEGIEVKVRHAAGAATVDEVVTEASQLVGSGDFANQEEED